VALRQCHRHSESQEPGSNVHIVLEQSFCMLVECRLVVHAGVKKKGRDALLLSDACMFVEL